MISRHIDRYRLRSTWLGLVKKVPIVDRALIAGIDVDTKHPADPADFRGALRKTFLKDGACWRPVDSVESWWGQSEYTGISLREM